MHLDMLHKLECNVHFNITICRSGHKLIYAHSSPKLITLVLIFLLKLPSLQHAHDVTCQVTDYTPKMWDTDFGTHMIQFVLVLQPVYCLGRTLTKIPMLPTNST